jgi:hypothetical protein
MEGEARNGPGQSLKQGYSVSEGQGRLTLTQQRNPVFAPFLAGRGVESQWDIRLSSRTPLDLIVDTGVGEANLDLSGLSLTSLDLDTGIGQATVTFPASGAIRARINSGVGDVTLIIPADLPTRLTVDSGLTSVSVPARFSREGDVYTTPGFAAAGHYLELEVDAGIGAVTIR